MLHTHAIKWGIENNYEKYDFGNTESIFTNGLFKFKQEFGGKVVPTLEWEKNYSKLGGNIFKIGRYLYKKSRTELIL